MSWVKTIWAVKIAKNAAVTEADKKLQEAKDYADSVSSQAKTEAVSESKEYTDTIATAFSSGATILGSVNTPSDLPGSATVGDAYVVIYGGSDPTVVTNSVYVYTSDGWKRISAEPTFTDTGSGNIQITLA